MDEDADPTQAWFTTKDDKQTLTTRGHSWKQGQWSKDEVDILQGNISTYCKVSAGAIVCDIMMYWLFRYLFRLEWLSLIFINSDIMMY